MSAMKSIMQEASPNLVQISEFHLVDERIVAKKPTSLGFADAAAVPLTAITASEGLFERLSIPFDADKNSGRNILIIGGAGGVGSMAIQLAKHVGLCVVATASRPESIDWASKMGADFIIDHNSDDFSNAVGTAWIK